MGTQKLLLPVGGQPVIAHIVDEVLASPVDRSLLSSARRDRMAAAGRPAGRFVTNPDERRDAQFRALRLGRAADECTAVMVVLGDQPGSRPDVVAQLVRAFVTAGRGIVVPTSGGRRGHPISSRAYRDEILTRYERSACADCSRPIRKMFRGRSRHARSSKTWTARWISSAWPLAGDGVDHTVASLA